MTAIVDSIKGWAQTAQRTAVWIVFVLSTVLSIAAAVIFVYDVMASYTGWGVMVETHTAIDAAPRVLGATLAMLPTVIQIVFFTALVSGLTSLSDHAVLRAVSAAMFALDSVLDFFALYEPARGWESAVFSIIIVLVVYGVLSEILFSFFTPVAVALGRYLLGNVQFTFKQQ